MSRINEKDVLKFYLEEIHNDEISFLVGKEKTKEMVSESILDLKNADNMNDKIEVSKKLWKILFEAAMSYIDPDKRGYDELFHYFDEYVNFEELIFASDSFYRDHTIHCLWVYFLGEFLLKNEEFQYLFENRNEQYDNLRSIIEAVKEIGAENRLKTLDYALGELLKIEKFDDSVRCISALTHDLGYPLKKIGKINKSIGKILPYFKINSFNEFTFSFDNTQKSNIESFLDNLSLSVNLEIGEEDEVSDILNKIIISDKGNAVGVNKDNIKLLTDKEIEVLKSKTSINPRLNRNRPIYIRYTNDFEEYNHGIMSAFLLMRIIKAFGTSKLFYSDNYHIDLFNIDYADLLAKQLILRAISDHTSAIMIRSIDDISAILTFVDELEEFSRISRANQSRQYVSEFCKTDIYSEDGVFNVDFIFDNENIDNLDPEKAFKGRCKRFLTMFNIPRLKDNLKLRLRCIGKLPYDNNTYSLEIRRKFAKITINGEEKDIPSYLKGRQFYTREEYSNL